MKLKIKEVMFFPNGNTAVFNKKGDQIPALQKSWLMLFVEFLESKGADPEKANYRMPDGRVASLVKVDSGWNWKFF